MIFKKYIKNLFYGGLVTLGLISLCSLNVQAQKRLKFSNTEDIAIAFYKGGKTVPNFERWITEHEPYKITPWANRERVMEEEKTRLQLAYNRYNPEKDYLLVRTFVTLAPQIKQNKGKQNKSAEDTYTLNAKFSEAPDALYFPYDFLGERIVVLPHKIDKFMNSPLTKEQFALIKKRANASQNTMIVRMRATESDLSRPYDIDGLKQWVLKTEIVTLEIWNKGGQLVWEYSAPWYVSPKTKALNNLYSDQPVQSPHQGSVKPLILNP